MTDAAVVSAGYKAGFSRHCSPVRPFTLTYLLTRKSPSQFQHGTFGLPVPRTKTHVEVTDGFGRSVLPPNKKQYPRAWLREEKVAGIRF